MGAVELGLGWLAHSGIRHADDGSLASGGVNQGYDWQRRHYPFVYSEITGYAVSTFVNAYRWTGDEVYLSLAGQAARFLLRLQGGVTDGAARGAIPHSLSLPDLEVQRQYYSFDGAMCLQGLLDLHAVRPDERLEEAACAIGDWLVERMQRADGAFWAMYDGATGERQHAGENFYDDGGCLHAKHAIGLLRLSQATGDGRYAEAARRVCDWVLALQDEDGAFRASERLPEVVSHPHCYAAEGLLYAHYVLGVERYLEAARRAGEWLLRVQNRDGSVNMAYRQRWWRMGRRVVEKLFPPHVTDATAQAVRIWLILYYLDGETRFREASRRAASFLRCMQCVSAADPNAYGGFYYARGHPMMFAWCAMFSVAALHAVDHIQRESGYPQAMRELF
jgi:hypothetical protein